MLSRTHRRRSRRTFASSVAVAVAAAVLQGLGATAASADPCADTSVGFRFGAADSTAHFWDFDARGAISDGGGADAYDGWGTVAVNNVQYSSADQTTCRLEPDGQQFDFAEIDLAGLKVSRKAYVPTTGAGFARTVTFLRNPSLAPVTVSLTLTGDVGSDASTKLLATSSGDAVTADPNDDSWVVTADSATAPGDPPLAHVFDSTQGGVADRADHLFGTGAGTTPWANGADIVRAIYDDVTIPAGATVSYMQVEAQRDTIDQAKAVAPALAAQPAEVFADLTDDELATVQNWNTSDLDADGVKAAGDNCRRVANADQSDLDHDGIGDACDSDIDGDGVKAPADDCSRVANPDQADLDHDGTGDACDADTDGDGVDDKNDACPAVAGKGANGCARFDTAPDRTAPKVSLTAKSKLKVNALLKGVRASAKPSEASSLTFELLATTKRATIAKASDLVLASRSLKAAAGRRSVTLRPSRALIGSAKRFTLRLRVTATDASGNRTIKTKTIRVSG